MSWPWKDNRPSPEVTSPSTPVGNNLNFDEYYESPKTSSAFCSRLSEDEFDRVGIIETEKCLKDLIDHLNNDSSTYLKLLRKRKIEDIENAGVISFLKCKLMSTFKGPQYSESLVSVEDCQSNIKELAEGMLLVHRYAKEAKTTRFSQRLADKKNLKVLESQESKPQRPSSSTNISDSLRRPTIHSISNIQTTSTPLPLPLVLPSIPPPLPPPLPPFQSPLKEKNVFEAPSRSEVENTHEKEIFVTPTAMNDLHSELISSNPLKRLRSTRIARTPAGTPLHDSVCDNRENPSDPLGKAFQRILQAKFQNIKSPQSDITTSNDTSYFSP